MRSHTEEPPLIPDQRRQKILELLSAHEVLSVHQLTELLGVSHMTVRRDIGELVSLGVAAVVPGGVRSARSVTVEPSFDAKASSERAQKAAIGLAAGKLLRDDGVYYLDAGTTTSSLLPAIRALAAPTVVTNDFTIVTSLIGDGHVEVVHVGGKLDHANRSSVGHLAAGVLRQLAVDIAFVSASSWDAQRGVTTPSAEKVDVKLAAMEVASSAVLLATSSKLGSYSIYRVCGLDRFSSVITDEGISEADAAAVREIGVELVTAAVQG